MNCMSCILYVHRMGFLLINQSTNRLRINHLHSIVYGFFFFFFSLFHSSFKAFHYCCTGAPIVTSLVFHNESRTLTCTSTGGPATRVIWKKAGKLITLNITYNLTQRITNLINGTYQTVLSTAPAVTDINDAYSCMVENTRGLSTAITEITSEDLLLSCFQVQ